MKQSCHAICIKIGSFAFKVGGGAIVSMGWGYRIHNVNNRRSSANHMSLSALTQILFSWVVYGLLCGLQFTALHLIGVNHVFQIVCSVLNVCMTYLNPIKVATAYRKLNHSWTPSIHTL